jgi:arginyl-tRNA synthetase
MMIEKILAEKATEAISLLYGRILDPTLVTVQKTRAEFDGDLTVVVFPFTRYSGKSPEETGKDIGNWLQQHISQVNSFNVVKGFLNLVISDDFWQEFFLSNLQNFTYGFIPEDNNPPVVIEYSSPNTNKPLHLGHIRNNLLGWSIAEILKANGRKVIKVNLVMTGASIYARRCLPIANGPMANCPIRKD